MNNKHTHKLHGTEPRLFYGYIVVTVAFFIMVVSWAIYNSFGVFFRPLQNEFGWTSAMTSGAFSLSMIIYGVLGIVVGGLNDRFGPLPPEVTNLLYAVRIKALAAKAGIESIATEQGEIIIRRFQGMHFDKQRLEPLTRDGIRIGLTQIRMNPKKLGEEWQSVLEEILGKIR